MEYARLKDTSGSDVSLKDIGFQTDFRVYLHLRQTWLAFSESTGYVMEISGRHWMIKGAGYLCTSNSSVEGF